MTTKDTELMLRALAGQDKFLTVSIPKIFLATFNKDMNTAMVFMELLGRSPQADKNGWFTLSIKEWTNILPLSKYQVTRSIKVLKDMGILSTEIKQVESIPRLHYRIHFEIISSLLREPLELMPAIPILPKSNPHFGVNSSINRPKVKLLNFGKSPINEWGLKWVPIRRDLRKEVILDGSIEDSLLIKNYTPKSILSVYGIDIIILLNIYYRDISKRNIINYIPFKNISYRDSINGWGFEPIPIHIPSIATFLKKGSKIKGNGPPITYSSIVITPMEELDIKESITSKTVPSKKSGTVDPLISFWNTLPGVRIHKDPSSKIYKKAKKKLDRLKQGKFRYNRFDGLFLKSKGITKDMLSRSYTDMEIREILKEMSKMFLPGYWPENKDWIPKDLSSLLFNERRNNSWFMACAAKPIESLDQKLCRQWRANLDPEDKETFDEFLMILEMCQGYKVPEREYHMIYKTLVDIYRFYNHLSTVMRAKGNEDDWIEIQRWFPSKYHFAIEYINWVQETYDNNNNFSYHWVKTNSSTWKRYLKRLLTDLGFENYLGEGF